MKKLKSSCRGNITTVRALMSSIQYHGLQRPERTGTDYGNILTLLELRAVLTIQKAQLKKIKWCAAMAALAGDNYCQGFNVIHSVSWPTAARAHRD